MGNKWFFALKFIYFSIVLLILWSVISVIYHRFLAYVAIFPLRLVNFDVAVFETSIQDIFYRHSDEVWEFPIGSMTANFIPFLSLVLSIPKIRLLRRIKVIGIGLGVLFVFHILSLISFPLVKFIHSYFGPAHFLSEAWVFLHALVLGLSPFVLWIFLVFKGPQGNIQCYDDISVGIGNP